VANELDVVYVRSEYAKLKIPGMQTLRILQAVLLMVVLAMAASCATSNEYVSKILKPRNAPEIVVAKKEPKPVRFLEFDTTGEESEQWVKEWLGKDSLGITKKLIQEDSISVTPVLPDPVARTGNPDGTRTKKSRDEIQK
jgi:hypothetical protein